jgi:hypothetical protein
MAALLGRPRPVQSRGGCGVVRGRVPLCRGRSQACHLRRRRARWPPHPLPAQATVPGRPPPADGGPCWRGPRTAAAPRQSSACCSAPRPRTRSPSPSRGTAAARKGARRRARVMHVHRSIHHPLPLAPAPSPPAATRTRPPHLVDDLQPAQRLRVVLQLEAGRREERVARPVCRQRQRADRRQVATQALERLRGRGAQRRAASGGLRLRPAAPARPERFLLAMLARVLRAPPAEQECFWGREGLHRLGRACPRPLQTPHPWPSRPSPATLPNGRGRVSQTPLKAPAPPGRGPWAAIRRGRAGGGAPRAWAAAQPRRVCDGAAPPLGPDPRPAARAPQAPSNSQEGGRNKAGGAMLAARLLPRTPAATHRNRARR